MLTIRRSQWTALADYALAMFKAQLFEAVCERAPVTVEALGRQRVEWLIVTCVETCREHGESGREAIASAVESLLSTEGVKSMTSAEVSRTVHGELDARRLYSMLETLAGGEVG